MANRTSSHELEKRIEEMLREGKLDSDQAIALMLASQAEVLSTIAQMQEQIRTVTEYQQRYPSLLWLANYRKRELLTVLIALFILYLFLIEPMSADQLREWLLATIVP